MRRYFLPFATQMWERPTAFLPRPSASNRAERGVMTPPFVYDMMTAAQRPEEDDLPIDWKRKQFIKKCRGRMQRIQCIIRLLL